MADTFVRPSRVSRWGNSAGVRLTSAVLEIANLNVDEAVDVIAREGEIVIRRQRPRVTLAGLLTKYDPEKHRHDLLFDDNPVGTGTAVSGQRQQHTPDRGDIIYANFTRHAGPEMAGSHPGIVLSEAAFSVATGMMSACPITNQVKRSPFEVVLPANAEDKWLRRGFRS